MIYDALEATANALNEYFSNRFGAVEDKVILSGIVNQDGSLAIPETDRVVMTLVNIQEERVTAQRNLTKGGKDPVNLYLYVLMSSYFGESNYSESLKFLSAVISYFQANSVLNHQNAPDLHHDIEKLIFEIVNQDLQNLSHLWGTVGGKYLPSILYKIRMISIDESISMPEASFLGFSSDSAS